MAVIEKFFSTFQQLRDHWLFWPFVLLLLQVISYNLLFSRNGYLSYVDKESQKAKITLEVAELKAKKEALMKDLGLIKNDTNAFSKFSREHLLYDNSVTILKFKGERLEDIPNLEQSMDIEKYQKIYFIVSTIVLCGGTFIFWQWNRRLSHE